MKKIMSFLALSAFLVIPAQSAFAWTYEGLGSLNPFTNFGRGFGNRECGCQRYVKPKLTKCEKLHGYKMIKGEPCGCAVNIVPIQEPCHECTRAF